MLPRELLQPIGGQPVERHELLADAVRQMRGRAQIAANRRAAVPTSLEIDGERFKVARQRVGPQPREHAGRRMYSSNMAGLDL